MRGRESAAASRVHAASCSGFSEALCLSESVKPPVRTRGPFCAAREAGRPSGKAENSSGLCQRAKSLPSKHGLCACRSCRQTSRGRPVRLLGRTSAPPGRSPRSVARSERVSFLRQPLDQLPLHSAGRPAAACSAGLAEWLLWGVRASISRGRVGSLTPGTWGAPPRHARGVQNVDFRVSQLRQPANHHQRGLLLATDSEQEVIG